MRLTNAAAQLPYGSGETKGVLLLRSQAERKEKRPHHSSTLLVDAPVDHGQSKVGDASVPTTHPLHPTPLRGRNGCFMLRIQVAFEMVYYTQNLRAVYYVLHHS